MSTLRMNKSPVKEQNHFRISILKRDPSTTSNSQLRTERLNKTASLIEFKTLSSPRSPSFFTTNNDPHVSKLELPSIKVPLQTPKDHGNANKDSQVPQGTYSELLRQQAEHEKKKEEALYLSKTINHKVENLAIKLAAGHQRELRSLKKKSSNIEDPVLTKKTELKALKPERIKTILGKVKTDMTSAGLSDLLTSRSNRDPSPTNRSDLMFKNDGSVIVKKNPSVRFADSPSKDPLSISRKTVNVTFTEQELAKNNKKTAQEDNNNQKSAKERLIISIQSINTLNDNLRSYASTFLDQAQNLSEHRGKHKKHNPERAQTQMPKKQAKILLSKKFRRTIWFLVDKMRMLKLTMEELCTEKVFSSRPYEDPDSPMFFKYCKTGNLSRASQMLAFNKYIVHNYDDIRKTPLHWAIKRKHNRIAKMLLDYGADPNALDLVGRNPLFMAASSDNLIGAKLLLHHRADPTKYSEGKRGVLDYAVSFRLKQILEKGKEVFISMEIAPHKMKADIWKRFGLPNFVVREDELDDD